MGKIWQLDNSNISAYICPLLSLKFAEPVLTIFLNYLKIITRPMLLYAYRYIFGMNHPTLVSFSLL